MFGNTPLGLDGQKFTVSFSPGEKETSSVPLKQKRHAACCHVISPHVFHSAVNYYEAKEKQYKIDAFRQQLHHLEGMIYKGREVMLKKMMALCSLFGLGGKLEELYNAMHGHLNKHIEHLEERGLFDKAQKFRSRLDDISKQFEEGEVLFDDKEWLEEIGKEFVLKKAIALCERFDSERGDKELHNVICEHFEGYIQLFDQEGFSGGKETLGSFLRKIRSRLDKRKDFLDLKGWLKKLNKWADKETKGAQNENKVYRVAEARLSHREKLPGTLVRKTGQNETNDPEIDDPFGFSDVVELYSSSHQGISFEQVLGGKARISSVGSTMDNAYWTPQEKQIVIGKGEMLFKNLASTRPGNRSVIIHEWWHAIIDYLAGLNLENDPGGLDYICEKMCDAGALNEAFSDIGAVVQMIESLKEGDVEVSTDDPRVEECFKIGQGLWIKGTPGDALRNAETGIGYAEDGAVARQIGKPVEKWFLRYDNWHENSGVVHNWPQANGLIRGVAEEVDPHHGSACPLAVFVEQLKLLGIPARKVHKIWLEAVKNTTFRTSLPQFAKNTVDAIRAMEAELGMGDNPENAIRKGWGKYRVPIAS